MSDASLSNWKTSGTETWGPLSNLPRAEAIFKACTLIDAKGESPSRERVRELIGGGSDRDIFPVIKLYQSRKSLFSEFEYTPETLLVLMAKQVDQVFSNLDEAYDARQEQEKVFFIEASEELTKEIAEVEALNGELSEKGVEQNLRIEQLIEELHQRDEAVDSLQGKLMASENRLKEKVVLNDQLTDRLREKTEQLQLLEEKHEQALKAAQQESLLQRQTLMKSHDDETARLMTVQGNERTEWQRNERKLNKSLDDVNLALNNSQRQVEQKSNEIIVLKQDAQGKEAQLIAFKNELMDQDALMDELETLKKRTQQLEQDNERLEKDITEASDVAGQLQLLQKQISALNVPPKSRAKKEKKS